VSINKKIRMCPQHELGATTPARLSYLLRTCPSCMKWLGEHPEDARIARQFIPGTYASTAQGAYDKRADRPRLIRAAAKRDKQRREAVPPRFPAS
jgi:hypothetical protein